MNCLYCKCRLFDSDRFCPACGAPIIPEEKEHGHILTVEEMNRMEGLTVNEVRKELLLQFENMSYTVVAGGGGGSGAAVWNG